MSNVHVTTGHSLRRARRRLLGSAACLPPASRSQCLYRPGRVAAAQTPAGPGTAEKLLPLGTLTWPDQRPPGRASRMVSPTGPSGTLCPPPERGPPLCPAQEPRVPAPGAGPDRAGPQAGSGVCKCQQKSTWPLSSLVPTFATVCLFSKDKVSREITRGSGVPSLPREPPGSSQKTSPASNSRCFEFPSRQIATSESSVKGHTFKIPAPEEEAGSPPPDTPLSQARLSCLPPGCSARPCGQCCEDGSLGCISEHTDVSPNMPSAHSGDK